MNNSKGFIIDKKDYEKITNEQKDIIGEKIFFTSYYRLIRYTKKLIYKQLLLAMFFGWLLHGLFV